VIQFTYTLGAQRTLAANAAIITLSIRVLVAVTASLMPGEQWNIVRVLAFVIALAGVLLTSVPNILVASFGQRSYLAGNLLFFVACAASAFYNAYCKFLVDRHYTELEILVYTSVIGSAGSIPLFIWLEPLRLSTLLGLDCVAILGHPGLAFIVYGLVMLLFFAVLKRRRCDSDESRELPAAVLYRTAGSGGAQGIDYQADAGRRRDGPGEHLVVTVYERKILGLLNRTVQRNGAKTEEGNS
jgi:hypothetical protein